MPIIVNRAMQKIVYFVASDSSLAGVEFQLELNVSKTAVIHAYAEW
jgi:hypothetical protein